jgi:hypothetical protein
MSYSIYLALAAATAGPCKRPDEPVETAPDLEDHLQPALQRIHDLVERFRSSPITPRHTARFEQDLLLATRELGRSVAGWTYNQLEPADVQALPVELRFEGSTFRRLGKKTPQQVSTLFGPVTLRRLGYRAGPLDGEPVLFPLCRQLGLVHGATPALFECVARYQAEGGATQKRTLQRLRREHGLCWGVKRLRQVTDFVAQAAAEHRQDAQVEQVLAWLTQAQTSHGRHKPVLSVGRDGITVGLKIKGGSIKEVATTGTLSVYDRRGKRLGTVYLAYTPEAGQAMMSTQLTRLVREVLRRWSGPLPRLSYVTDAGDNETAYYRKVLRRMRHPLTGKRLSWQWVVDYYHASLRLTTMADALFGKGQQAAAWTRKMQKLLLKPGGAGRVLHSAGALRSRYKPRGERLKEFQVAYRYLQERRKHMRYAEYRRVGMPIGSGVTEAACKTVYTQRLKLSGMRWKKAGAQTILTLRVILLSGVWSQVFEQVLNGFSEVTVRVAGGQSRKDTRKPA